MINFVPIIWIHHEKSIKIRTNKPIFGPVVLDTACCIFITKMSSSFLATCNCCEWSMLCPYFEMNQNEYKQAHFDLVVFEIRSLLYFQIRIHSDLLKTISKQNADLHLCTVLKTSNIRVKAQHGILTMMTWPQFLDPIYLYIQNWTLTFTMRLNIVTSNDTVLWPCTFKKWTLTDMMLTWYFWTVQLWY